MTDLSACPACARPRLIHASSREKTSVTATARLSRLESSSAIADMRLSIHSRAGTSSRRFIKPTITSSPTRFPTRPAWTDCWSRSIAETGSITRSWSPAASTSTSAAAWARWSPRWPGWGWTAHGVEPSEAAVRRAREIGLNVQLGMIHDAGYPDRTFDSVSLYHSLEHTPDPVAVLAECRRVLKPAGEIVVGVPNFGSLVRPLVGWSWSAYDLPRHLHHFSQSSIRSAAARAGLFVTAMETESLPEHVELELVTWLRRRLKVPARLTLKTRAARPVAAYLANKGNASGRGESIVVHLRSAPP